MSVATWVGYPASYTAGRARAIQGVCVHYTAGSEGPTSAENGASYDKRRTDGTSCHVFADSDSVVCEVPDRDRSHSAYYRGNEIFLHLELCGTAQTRAAWLDDISRATLRNGAKWAAEKCKAYGIPVRRLSEIQTRQAYYAAPGARPRGLVGHIDVTMAFPEDNGDHTDPGSAFPWDVFLDMVGAELATLNGTGVSDMAKIVRVDDTEHGKGASFASGGSGWWHLPGWDQAVAYAARWGISADTATWPLLTSAQAVAELGPRLDQPAPAPRLILIDDGPHGPGAVYRTNGVTREWVATPEALGAFASAWGLIGSALPRVASADADALYGVDVETLRGRPGEPGPATLVPHTHGDAQPIV